MYSNWTILNDKWRMCFALLNITFFTCLASVGWEASEVHLNWIWPIEFFQVKNNLRSPPLHRFHEFFPPYDINAVYKEKISNLCVKWFLVFALNDFEWQMKKVKCFALLNITFYLFGFSWMKCKWSSALFVISLYFADKCILNSLFTHLSVRYKCHINHNQNKTVLHLVELIEDIHSLLTLKSIIHLFICFSKIMKIKHFCCRNIHWFLLSIHFLDFVANIFE